VAREGNGRHAGNLLLRAFERSERIYEAMLSRATMARLARYLRAIREQRQANAVCCWFLALLLLVLDLCSQDIRASFRRDRIAVFRLPDGHAALKDISLTIAPEKKSR